MTGFTPAHKPIFPSRQDALNQAIEASEHGGTIFIVGDLGLGRTTFTLQLIDRLQENFHWILAARALKDVAFSTLSLIASQIPNGPTGASPIELVTGLGQVTQNSQFRILVDHAEFVDEQSAAVIKQLSASRNIQLILGTTSVKSLPEELRSMLTFPDCLRIDLKPLTSNDADLLLTELLGGPVTPSTTAALLEMSTGHVLLLRELALDARNAGALSFQGNYWTLDLQWLPYGSRTSDLVDSRLNSQTGNVREFIEQLAVTGPLQMDMALELVGDVVFDAFDSGLAVQNFISENPATGERSSLVQLGPGLSPQLVLSTLDSPTLRRHLITIEKRLPWACLDASFRSRYSRHRLEMGLEVPPKELLADTIQAAQSRQFSRVLALTDLLGRQKFESKDLLEQLLIARADALYELRQPEAALALLKEHLDSGGPELRFVAAKIAYASLGKTEAAEQILAPRSGDPVSVEAYLLLIRSRSNQVVDLSALERYSQLSELSAEGRMAFLAHLLIERAYGGNAEDSMTEFLGCANGAQWSALPASVRSELIFSLPSLTFALGVAPSSMISVAGELGADQTAPNHGNVMISSGLSLLECGYGAQALDVFEQALSFTSVNDTYLLQGFVALLAARASTMLGDEDRAKRYLELSRAQPAFSGQIVRPAVQVGLVSVLAFLEGRDSALREFERQMAQARLFGRKYLMMRLHFEAWQCGLSEDLSMISAAAAEVQGPLAKLLAGYESALCDPSEQSIGSLVKGHIEAEHVLFAAQLANKGAERARALGRRSVSAHLLNLSLDLAQPLIGVNTAALGRGRIDQSVLTEREYATCALAAAGASNQAISEKLFLSTRTVEGHLQRSYTKLGITDRRQLIPDLKVGQR
ncbi:LuxR C-terminal-related transcriptional regulator [Glutamicibacter sp.]|uniref:LuxR C-terminal-related transcriptional regulator n=1 Tax=Glutamicibacter sp. TaxID=1931995 RepID=UPI0028BE204C|nr:LuxR C-terminal-related transcriptional regulator [Glutamicibacter sp.]